MGLIETIVSRFDFKILPRTHARIWDREGAYPLEISLHDFRFGGLSYKTGNTILFYKPGVRHGRKIIE